MKPHSDDLHLPCFCLGCHTVVDERDAACIGCGRSFAGTGRFDRISGTPPAARPSHDAERWPLAS